MMHPSRPLADPASAPSVSGPPSPARLEDADRVRVSDHGLFCAARKVLPGRLVHLLDLASHALRAARAGIALVGTDGGLGEHLTYGMSRDEAGALEQSPAFTALLCGVPRQPTPVRFTGGSGEFGPALGVPLSGAGRGRGLLYLLREPGEPAFSDAEGELLAPIGLMLEQANLSEEARLLNRLRVLNEVAQAASWHLDLTSIVRVTLRALDRQLPLHASAVWLVEDEEAGSHAEGTAGSSTPREPELVLAGSSTAYGLETDGGLAVGSRLKRGESIFGDCLQEGRVFYAELDGLAHGPANPRAERARQLAGWGVRTVFAVPLRAGERIVGVLQSLCMRPAGFTGEQMQLLYLVADLLGPAISNCQLFRHRTAALEELRRTQSQLIQAEKMRALGELAGGVAHEFNNALCGVLGFLELALLNQSLDPSNRAFLESARTCATDAAQTVRRVQDFARWRRNEPASQPLALDEFVRQTVELIRHKWEGFGAQRVAPVGVVLETEAGAVILGNSAELREVLTNLAFNAVEAMPRGGTLTFRVWKTRGDGYFSVRDTGVGIAQAVRHRLFEPFFTTKGERGNGLGLSVAFGIVRRHSGEITVESEEGRGTVFTVRLPLASSQVAGLRPAVAPAAPVAGRSLRVLVVEDEATVRRYLETGLTRLGHRPRLTCDVEEATAALAEGDYDVVLSDLGLPDASGEELARRVGVHSPRTPVVLLTGWADQLHAEQRAISGVSRILGKPVTLDTLAATLTSVAG